jgi:hypothetical protein
MSVFVFFLGVLSGEEDVCILIMALHLHEYHDDYDRI